MKYLTCLTSLQGLGKDDTTFPYFCMWALFPYWELQIGAPELAHATALSPQAFPRFLSFLFGKELDR